MEELKTENLEKSVKESEYKKQDQELLDKQKELDKLFDEVFTDEMKEMLKKKEKTDAWIIEKATNESKTNEKLISEVNELKQRVHKLEKILEQVSEALK